MDQVKGSNLSFIRDEFKRRGNELEQRFLSTLSREERTTYSNALAFSWIPVTIVATLWEKASELFYPGDKKMALRRLGLEAMTFNLKGLYKVAMHVTGIHFAIEQSARVWGTYHDTGNARCEKRQNSKELLFVVSGYPNLPPAFQETVAGSIEATITTGGGKLARVTYQQRSGGTHEWLAKWE